MNEQKKHSKIYKIDGVGVNLDKFKPCSPMEKVQLRSELGYSNDDFIITVVASIIMFTGFKFMHTYENVLESTKIGMLRFFTVESNLLMGIVSLLFASTRLSKKK